MVKQKLPKLDVRVTMQEKYLYCIDKDNGESYRPQSWARYNLCQLIFSPAPQGKRL